MVVDRANTEHPGSDGFPDFQGGAGSPLASRTTVCPMSTNPDGRRATRLRAGCAIAASLVGVSFLAAACTSSASTATSTTVSTAAAGILTPAYAKDAGFPKTLSAAKTSAVSTEKGCSISVGAVYQDSVKKTALITSVLKCDSAAAASTAFTTIKTHYGADATLIVPQGLGASAFATSRIAPQYLLVWQRGSKVAITAVDVNLAAARSTTGTVTSPPLTKAQENTLDQAAEAQNALMK